jgi:hypothetical protein
MKAAGHMPRLVSRKNRTLEIDHGRHAHDPVYR